MNLKYRMLIARIKPLHRAARMFMRNSGLFFYQKMYKENHYDIVFKELHNSKFGKRCFIIGNGPSLHQSDLDRLIGEDCFASNGIFKVLSKTMWRPKYYMIMDRYFKTTREQILSTDAEYVFLGDYFLRFNDIHIESAICVHEHCSYSPNRIDFSEDISKNVTTAPTVSYGLMQLAAYMGYKEVYLLGFDHNYGFELTSDGDVVRTDTAAHFYEDEIPEEVIGDVIGMTKAYEVFKQYAQKHGMTVKNATRGGKLEVFERVDFDELMEKRRL